MSGIDVSLILEQVERLLAEAGPLPEMVQRAVEKLLNVVEALSADKKELAAEVERLRKQLERKKKDKTTKSSLQTDNSTPPNQNHSSEKRRESEKKPRPSRDRRSGKDLTIHDTIECPVDPASLPPDAVRLDDEAVVVQDIEIRPKNTRFLRQVFYSPSQRKTFRGPLPPGCDLGDFSGNLRAFIIALKYCGNMSEPKIGELLENFDIQVSSGSISNILTKSATSFEQDYHDVLVAGLSSTPYQQTDDTSARVKGQSWHTHILCNPFYTFYSTRPRKDRLTVLSVLQNTEDLHFRFGPETLELLDREFRDVPAKWWQRLEALDEAVFTSAELQALLDDWFGEKNRQLRTAIEHASAISFYRHQEIVPVVRTWVCDDAGQFKSLTEYLALCWIHDGRHYAKLSPVVRRHALLLESFLERYWAYYKSLQNYRASPSAEAASRLRQEFDELFSTQTGYEALDARIAKTRAKRESLLTVLSQPWVPLHNNDSELGARVSARRRDVSLHSRSERGVRAMDIFTTLVQTAKKLGISVYGYLRDRLSGVNDLPSLSASLARAASV